MSQGGEKLRQYLAESLLVLKAQAALTCVAVELDSDKQAMVDSLNPDNPNLEVEISALAPVGWYEGNMVFLAAAKKAGFRVICIDLLARGNIVQRDTAKWQNTRNSHMFATLERMTSSDERVLVFLGSDHIHKKSVKKYPDGAVVPLGMHLVEKYGEESIVSVRPVYRESGDHFDDLMSFMSKTSRVSEVVDKDGPVVIVPDEGPIKGDPQVTATDYVVIA